MGEPVASVRLRTNARHGTVCPDIPSKLLEENRIRAMEVWSRYVGRSIRDSDAQRLVADQYHRSEAVAPFTTSTRKSVRIQSVHLKNYKRFSELTIAGLPETARLVVLVGPNGSGKSSVFGPFLLKAAAAANNWRLDGTREQCATKHVAAKVMERTDKETLQGCVRAHAKDGAKVYTDYTSSSRTMRA